MPDKPQYIFGYGSLVESKSRQMTWASAFYASPCVVKGIERGWFDQTGGSSITTTYLGAVAAEGKQYNGVIFSQLEQVFRKVSANLACLASGYVASVSKQPFMHTST